MTAPAPIPYQRNECPCTSSCCCGSGTVVLFHAHPDDEAIFTGGAMRLLHEAGHRVVLVLATRGELGDARLTFDLDEPLPARREAETALAAALLGVDRVAFLPYEDSGMAGDAANLRPHAFWGADESEAAALVADVLKEERAAALVVYDERGIYGHPDHVKVHTVGLQAAELAGTPVVYEATVDRDHLGCHAPHLVENNERSGPVSDQIGVVSSEVALVLDVRAVLGRKRSAIAAHSSQVPASDVSLQLDSEAFAGTYGFEWFLRRGAPGPLDALPAALSTALA